MEVDYGFVTRRPGRACRTPHISAEKSNKYPIFFGKFPADNSREHSCDADACNPTRIAGTLLVRDKLSNLPMDLAMLRTHLKTHPDKYMSTHLGLDDTSAVTWRDTP